MKYLMTYEFFKIEPTDAYAQKIKKSNDLSSQRREMMSEMVSEIQNLSKFSKKKK